jgi:hypothetical protein
MNETGERTATARSKSYWMLAAAAALAAGAIVLTFAARSLLDARPKEESITLVYIGAEDCAPCRKWQREDAVAFRSSAEFARVTYREVKSPVLFDVLKDEYWPDDLRRYREQLPRGAGVPLWLVVADGRIVEQRFGAAQWQAAVLPKVRSLLR